MRFAIRSNDPRIVDLVVALDRDGTPAAQTWRLAGEAAERLGLRRPSYEHVRRLVRHERLRRETRAARRRAAAGVVLAAGSPYVVRISEALERLEEAQRAERLVTLRHKPLEDERFGKDDA